MNEPRPFVIVRPEIATEEMRAILDKAGYVMLPGEPGDFQVVRVAMLGEVELISRAALEVIRDSNSGTLQAQFGFKVARALAQPPLPPTSAKSKPRTKS